MLTRKHQKLTNENLMKTKIHNSKCDMKTAYRNKNKHLQGNTEPNM